MKIQQLDRIADYIPGVSFVTNAIELGYKGGHFIAKKVNKVGTTRLATSPTGSAGWKAHVVNKPVWRCMLCLIPGVNLSTIAIDLYKSRHPRSNHRDHSNSEASGFREPDSSGKVNSLDDLVAIESAKNPNQHTGPIRLEDFLLQMKAPSLTRIERLRITEKMSFSQISQIVLEARKAIIEKVESSIPSSHRNILFLLGPTGSGKTTTFCFLRGDKMRLDNFEYKSEDDKSGLIGQELAISCTFLPNIEVINGLVIVDFPGFDDTNGPLVSIGVECALKALIPKIHPKILVLDSITDTAGRYSNAAKLGQLLNRLLENKKNCQLGLTKYSQDCHFRSIKDIEKQQIKERLDPTQEERCLIIQIETLSSLNNPKFNSDLQKKQEQLAKIQQKQEQQLQLPLPETDEKKESRKCIQEIEKELLNQIELETLIRFCDLEDPSDLSTCLATLSEPAKEEIRVNPQHLLNPHDKQLLKELFTNDLLKVIETQKNWSVEHKDFESFTQSVLESSLIKTLFSQSNPEIGEFLHMPEMDSNIVREFDREIVSGCLQKYMQAVIGLLNISSINKRLEEMAVPKDKIVALNGKLNELRAYLMRLLGSDQSKDPSQLEEQWNQILRNYASTKPIEEELKLPAWVRECFHIPLDIPTGILSLIDSKAPQKKAKQRIDIAACCKELDEIQNVFHCLKALERIVERDDTAKPNPLISPILQLLKAS